MERHSHGALSARWRSDELKAMVMQNAPLPRLDKWG